MRFVAILTIAALAACTRDARKPVSPPSYSGSVNATAEGRRNVTEIRGKMQSAKVNVQSAQQDAGTLLRTAPMDLRPLVEALQTKLTIAIVDLDAANDRAIRAEAMLALSESLAKEADAKAQSMQDALFAAESKVVEKDRALEQMNASRNQWRSSSLKWMALFWGGMVGLVLFFFRAPLFTIARRLVGIPV